MRGLVVLVAIAIAALSLWWTTRTARRVLGDALGRKLRNGEETSLKSWMEASDLALERATEELDRDPFGRPLRLADRMLGGPATGGTRSRDDESPSR
jgi:hypothetical protein